MIVSVLYCVMKRSKRRKDAWVLVALAILGMTGAGRVAEMKRNLGISEAQEGQSSVLVRSSWR